MDTEERNEASVSAQLNAKGYRLPRLDERGGRYVMVCINGDWTSVRGIPVGK